MFYVTGHTLAVSYEVATPVGEHVFSPPRAPVSSQYSTHTSIGTITSDEISTAIEEQRTPFQRFVLSKNAAHAKNPLLCYLHRRHGTVALYRFQAGICSKKMELIGTLCYRSRRNWKELGPVQCFVPTTMCDRPSWEQTGLKLASEEDWEAHHLTALPISAASFCANDKFVVVINSAGHVGSYCISEETDIKVQSVGSIAVVNGPLGPIAGIESAPLCVTSTFVGGYYYVVDVSVPEIRHSLQINLLSVNISMITTEQNRRLVFYVTHTVSQQSAAVSQFIVAGNEGNERDGHILGTAHFQAKGADDPLSEDIQYAYDAPKAQETGTELEGTLSEANCFVLSECTNHPVVSVAIGPQSLLAVGFANAIVLIDFSVKPSKRNVAGIIGNWAGMDFTHVYWLWNNVSEETTILIVRADGVLLFYECRVAEGSVIGECKYLRQLDGGSRGASFFVFGDNILAVRERHHSMSSSEAPPILALYDLNGEIVVDEFSEFNDHDVREGVAHMKLSDGGGGEPIVVEVSSDGFITAKAFGGTEDGEEKVLARTSGSARITAYQLIPLEGGRNLVVTGNEAGNVTVWENAAVVASCWCHTDAVTLIMPLPSCQERVGAVFLSLGHSGSLALHDMVTFNEVSIFHTPGGVFRGVFWDGFREYCVMVSDKGANFWHIVTGRLERFVRDQGFVRRYTTGMTNWLFSKRPDSLSKFCEISRMQFVQHSIYAVTIHLRNVLDAILLLKSEVDPSIEEAKAKGHSPRTELQPILKAAVAFVLCPGLCSGIDGIRATLGIPRNVYPKTRGVSLQSMYGTTSQRSTLHYIAIISTLRALGTVFSELEQPCVDATNEFIEIMRVELSEMHCHLPSIRAAVPLLPFPCSPVQYAARSIICSTLASSNNDELKQMLAQLDAFEGSPDEELREVGLCGKCLFVLQGVASQRIGTHLITRIGKDIEKTLLADAKRSVFAHYMLLAAEAWGIFLPHLTGSNAVMAEMFVRYCVEMPMTTLREYRRNIGARALVKMGLHRLERFFPLLDTMFVSDVAEKAQVFVAILQVLTRLIYAGPGKCVAHITKILSFVWRAIDPHSPNKTARERCFPVVASLFRMLVHCLPMVSFHQQQQRLAVGHSDGQVTVFDAKTTTKVAVFSAHSEPVACVAYSTIATDIATVSVAFESVAIWRLQPASIFGFLSSQETFKCIATLAIPSPSASVVSNEDLVKKCRLSWLSPSCVELNSPWHDHLQLMINNH